LIILGAFVVCIPLLVPDVRVNVRLQIFMNIMVYNPSSTDSFIFRRASMLGGFGYFMILCLALLPLSVASAVASAQDVALCSFLAATNMNELSAFSNWQCDSSSIPVTNPCGDGIDPSSIWSGITCLGQDVIDFNIATTAQEALAGIQSLCYVYYAKYALLLYARALASST
jgi:hypothetical protein